MKLEFYKTVKIEKHIYRYVSSYVNPNAPVYRTIDIIFRDGKFDDVTFPFNAPYTSIDLDAIKEAIHEIKSIEDR